MSTSSSVSRSIAGLFSVKMDAHYHNFKKWPHWGQNQVATCMATRVFTLDTEWNLIGQSLVLIFVSPCPSIPSTLNSSVFSICSFFPSKHRQLELQGSLELQFWDLTGVPSRQYKSSSLRGLVPENNSVLSVSLRGQWFRVIDHNSGIPLT